MSKKITWKSYPEAKDYQGAENFLTLSCSKADADALIDRLRNGETIERAGKDLLRAARLPLLSDDDPQVSDDLKDIRKGKPLAPVLLIRGDRKTAAPLIIADGYHRICASYIVDESSPIPCRLVDG